MIENSNEKIVTIFGGSKCPHNSVEYQEAKNLGALLAEAGFTICTGGYLVADMHIRLRFSPELFAGVDHGCVYWTGSRANSGAIKIAVLANDPQVAGIGIFRTL